MRNSLTWGRSPFDLFDEMNRFFESAGQQETARDVGFNRSVLADIHEDETQYMLALDIPGMKKEDIKVEVNDNILTVSGERKRDFEEGKSGKSPRTTERSYGYFQRSFALPTTVNAERVEAHYADGVLELVIPKAEAAKARRIEIQSGKSGAFGRLLNPNTNKRPETSTQTEASKH